MTRAISTSAGSLGATAVELAVKYYFDANERRRRAEAEAEARIATAQALVREARSVLGVTTTKVETLLKVLGAEHDVAVQRRLVDALEAILADEPRLLAAIQNRPELRALGT